MRMIVRIAKTELQSLFYSPIAWFVLVIFTFQCGLAFMESFEAMVRRQVLEEAVLGVSSGLFEYGVLQSVLNSIYLYIPLLTMGLISRELNSGSVKLLYSSPVKSRQIVLGKFGAMMVFGFVLIAILGLFFITAFLTVENFEWLAVLNGVLGIYLLICVYAAIGLFMSCLMSYQVAVAVCTLALLAVLNFIGNVGQEIAFVREITYWLSMSGRANHFLQGLLSSDDVVYFFYGNCIFLDIECHEITIYKTKSPVVCSNKQVWRCMLAGYLLRLPFFSTIDEEVLRYDYN